MRGHPALPTLVVARPCNSSWELMKGDDRVRHCTNCDKDVYNARELTRDELATLIREREGRLCMRLFQRPDGTVLTRECREARRTGWLPPRLGVRGFLLWALGAFVATVWAAFRYEQHLANEVLGDIDVFGAPGIDGHDANL